MLHTLLISSINFISSMASKSFISNYLIFHPEKIGLLDMLRLLLLRRQLTSYSFVEASSSTSLELGSATANWSIALTLIIQKILLDISSLLKWIGSIIEFALNLLSLNGGILSLIWNAIKGRVVIPKPGTAEFRSVVAHIDNRVDLYKSSSLLNYFSLKNSDHQKDIEDINLLDLSMVASKVAYENPAYIQNVVTDIWKMHFVGFFNCWNDMLGDNTTQAFIFSDKAKDATRICVAFRGTEPFDANDWKTDIDLCWISINLDGIGKYTGRVHVGFLGALGLLKNFDPTDVFPEVEPSGVGKPLAYYTIREALNTTLKANPNANILVTGHSLGGALAIMFSFLLHKHNQTDILNSMDRVMTYGQPRVGDNDFASYMENFTALHHQRMVYRYDIVPRVPFDLPPFSRFKHCGTCTYYESWHKAEEVDEVPNPNYFDMWYAYDMYFKAWSDLMQALIIGITEGSDYTESFVSILVRSFGLVIPGVASHSPRDYINAGRLINTEKPKKETEMA